jgi:hypothetical protein
MVRLSLLKEYLLMICLLKVKMSLSIIQPPPMLGHTNFNPFVH